MSDNRLSQLFKEKKNILNIYVTAGFPGLNDTIEIVEQLEKSGVDMVEIGMPFSDPMADGPTIQNSSEKAIKNGITLNLIFEQIEQIRKTTSIPIVMMGYYNQVIQYGDIEFFKRAKAVGVDGFILPDLPLNVFQEKYKELLSSLGLCCIFLITPQTPDERIKLIDKESSGFLYVVSSYSITGSKNDIQQTQINYFKRIKELNLTNPKLIGFGISNKSTFNTACEYAEGAIIGSAFIKALENSNDVKETTKEFIEGIKK